MAKKGRPLRLTTLPTTSDPEAIPTNTADPNPTPTPTPLPFLKAGNGMSLRRNRDPNPGVPDKTASRRPSAVVQAEKKAKEAEKEANKTARQKAIANAAVLEDKMAQEDHDKEMSVNHPPIVPIQKKERKRPENRTPALQPPSDEQEMQTTVAQSKRKRETNTKAKSPLADTMSRQKSIEDSGSEEEIDIEEFVDGLDDSGSEGKPEPKKQKTGKKKGEMRAQVQSQCVENKHSDDSSTPSAPNKKTKKIQKGGLRPGWQEQSHRSIAQPLAHGILSKSTNTTEDHEYKFDGFGDEDGDQGEALETAVSKSKPVKLLAKVEKGDTKPRALIKVQPTTSTPELVTPTKKRVKDIKVAGLPEDIRPIFSKLYTPAIIDLIGCLDAWSELTAAEYQKKWTDVVLADKHSLVQDVAFLKDLKILGGHSISNWRNTVATAALKELKAIFVRSKLETPEEQKLFVADMLNGTLSRDKKYFKYNYYYQNVAYEGDVLKCQEGLFQSSIITKAFAEYHKIVRTISEEKREPYNAEGALVLSVLAARCALSLYETGNFKILAGQAGHFSQKQWGDRMEIIENKPVRAKTFTSVQKLVRALDKLGPALWDKINDAAISHLPKSGRTATDAISVESGDEGSDEESEWELEDDDPAISAANLHSTKTEDMSCTAVTSGTGDEDPEMVDESGDGPETGVPPEESVSLAGDEDASESPE
ncbi:hypothetical protein VKT23_008160 [Stygiomarasmius scandens]|uniref:Uncharacterized protein n=1 Tax=Marasmiellus scandens TaxID=2682957 RepID=A0ABR1JHG3_9AGAR